LRLEAAVLIEKALGAPEMFYCERFRCTMMKTRCLERQERAAKINKDRPPWYRGPKDDEIKYEACRNCEQGKRIKEESMDLTGETQTKTCFKCGQDKPLEEFPKNKRLRDGHENKCKKCVTARAKQLRELRMKKAKRKDDHHPSPHRRNAAGRGDASLVLPIGDYPDLAEALDDAALKHIRSPEHQALAYIVKGLKEDGYGNDHGEHQ